ncbi:MAG: class I SAM-dependent methyltransferase [Candidatus Accumulibacter phosphatis]|jgi:ubiquinone/menaquinone biosynthesis C-methylase UbiE|uniref:class I SAM-dependent methyltransferase n=1 Tax=Candidatus Accumulibacter sp. ACC012 TaxID=2823332 RepID=UPI0025BF7ED4|nr:class I SAM-dependent methyltransferase [Candidatus Accumulibacter sp. ACC012]
MKMNSVEKFLMNNPIRAAFQRQYEAPLLEKLGGRTDGLVVLEVGCGRGVGTEEILERFAAKEVHALDVDPDMIKLARKRLAGYPSDRLRLSLGDVTQLDVEDATYDAVFDFAILHHVPVWQDGVAEIRRVLKPGGRFYFQEVTRHFLDKWFARTFLEHPAENRFSTQEFIAELERQRFCVGNNWVEKGGGDYVYGVGCCT